MNGILTFFGATWVKWVAVALVLASVAGSAAYEMHAHDMIAYNALKTKYDTFEGGVAALGEAAKKVAAKKAADDAKLKIEADNENKRTVANLRSTVARLRADADRARGSYVPFASAGAARPDLACFDRAALESAIRELIAEVRGFVDEGSAATVDLNTAKIWNQGRE